MRRTEREAARAEDRLLRVLAVAVGLGVVGWYGLVWLLARLLFGGQYR